MRKKKVAIVMGSDSDLPVVKKSIEKLDSLGIPTEVLIISAHRTPDLAANFAKSAISKSIGVVIAAAGMAAHLAGVIASHTTLPVIGLPIKATLEGLDSLLSTVQMPPGVPVATVGINGAENAAILAAQILAVYDEEISSKLVGIKKSMQEKIVEKNKNISLLEDGYAKIK